MKAIQSFPDIKLSISLIMFLNLPPPHRPPPSLNRLSSSLLSSCLSTCHLYHLQLLSDFACSIFSFPLSFSISFLSSNSSFAHSIPTSFPVYFFFPTFPRTFFPSLFSLMIYFFFQSFYVSSFPPGFLVSFLFYCFSIYLLSLLLFLSFPFDFPLYTAPTSLLNKFVFLFCF